MLEKLRRRVRVEKSHFDALGKDVKRLLWSFALFLSSWPMVVTFVNAYLWQQGEDIAQLIAYNVPFFVGLPIGFWANKLVLDRLHVLRVYWMGSVLQGLSALLVVFVPASGLWHLSMYGLVFGLGSALYWGNKSYLTLKLTRGKSRMYYQNIENAMDLLINIVVPVAVGWALVWGEMSGWYGKELAYRVMMLVGMGLLFVAGWVMQKAEVADFRVRRVWVRKPSLNWQRVRLLNMVSNISTGLGFIVPGVLVLSLVGDEGVLGTVSSVAAGLSAVVLYVVGRKVKLAQVWRVIWLGSVLSVVGTGALSVWWGLVGVLVYWGVEEVGRSLLWTNSFTLVMESMDMEEYEEDPEAQYAYMCDTELFFDIGRLVGVGLLLVMWWGWGLDVAMRYSLLVAAVLQVAVMGVVKKVNEAVVS